MTNQASRPLVSRSLKRTNGGSQRTKSSASTASPPKDAPARKRSKTSTRRSHSLRARSANQSPTTTSASGESTPRRSPRNREPPMHRGSIPTSRWFGVGSPARKSLKMLIDNGYYPQDRTGSHLKPRYEHPETGEVRNVTVDAR